LLTLQKSVPGVSAVAPSPALSPWKRTLRALAWIGVVVSFPLWGAAFLVAPFLPLPGEQRAALAALFLLVAEAVFWLGALYLGADVVARFRARFRRRAPADKVDAVAPARDQDERARDPEHS